MKKYIEREAARNMIEDWSGGFDYIEESVSDAIADLEAIPAADVREVVTCGECKWWTKQEASLQGSAEHIAEEIADVTIMMEQLRLIFNVNETVVEIMERKLERLQSRLEVEHG